MESNRWEHFYHSADVGIRGVGISLEEAFRQAGLALTAVVVDPGSFCSNEQVAISCKSADTKILFYDWLNAIIYEMSTRELVFCDYSVSINNGSLSSVAYGAMLDNVEGELGCEIKGATFTELKVERVSNGGWIAQCVIDV